MSSCGPRPKGSFAPNGWPQNAAGTKYSKTCRLVDFRAEPLPRDLDRRPEAPGPDLQFGNSPIEPDPPAHCHTATNDRGGTAEKQICSARGGGGIQLQKRPERARFLVWPARTNLEEGGGVRGATIYAHLRLRVRTPPCASVSFFVLFCFYGALGRKTPRAQTGGLCAVVVANVVRLGVDRASHFFCDFPRCAFCGLWRSVSAEDKNMGSGHVAPATPQNGLRGERHLFWHHGRSHQTHSHTLSTRELRANSA